MRLLFRYVYVLVTCKSYNELFERIIKNNEKMHLAIITIKNMFECTSVI